MGTQLFVGDRPPATQIYDLFQLFSELGEVEYVTIYRNRRTGRRWRMVEMEEGDAQRTIDKLDCSPWRGQRLTVRELTGEPHGTSSSHFTSTPSHFTSTKMQYPAQLRATECTH